MLMLLAVLIVWRCVWAVLSQTWYVPDETWQSVEVAHKMVWGRGVLTWEWDKAIRSSIHPSIFITIFKLLSVFHLDFQWLVILLPKLMTGILTAISDYSAYTLVKRKEGSSCAAWFMLLLQTNWFSLYSGSRTLINTLETSLFCLGLFVFPKPMFLSITSLSVMLRPTIAVPWLPICLTYLLSILRSRGLIRVIQLCILPIITIITVLLLDTMFYGFWTVTPYNFFQVNILHNLGQFYGTHPSYWYLTHALIPILGPVIVPSVLGLTQSPTTLVILPIFFTITFLSILPHKEMRFLQPIVPLLLYSAAKYMSSRTNRAPSSAWVVCMSLINIPIAMYLSLIHQRGTVDVSIWLGKSGLKSAMFLMPCHSTPLYSHTHSNISLSFLSCEPNLSQIPDYRDQAEIFYSAPIPWLEQAFPKNNLKSMPDSFILFDKLESEVKSFLLERNFCLAKNFFHSQGADGRVGSRVLVYCKEAHCDMD